MTQVYGLRCDEDHCREEIGTFTEPAEARRKALKAGWTVGEDEAGYDTDFCPTHSKQEKGT